MLLRGIAYLPTLGVKVTLKTWLTCARRYFWTDWERKDQRNTPSEEPQIAAWDTGREEVNMGTDRKGKSLSRAGRFYWQSRRSSPWPTDPSGPGSLAETRRDKSSANRKPEEQRRHITGCRGGGGEQVLVSDGLCCLTEASSPERTPGFLLRSRCRRELEYSSLEHRAWERVMTPERQRQAEIEKEREREGGKKQGQMRGYDIKRLGMLSKRLRFYIIHAHLRAEGVSECYGKQNNSMQYLNSPLGAGNRNKRHAACRAVLRIASQPGVVAGQKTRDNEAPRRGLPAARRVLLPTAWGSVQEN